LARREDPGNCALDLLRSLEPPLHQPLLDGLLAVLINRIDQGLEIKAPLGGERPLEGLLILPSQVVAQLLDLGLLLLGQLQLVLDRWIGEEGSISARGPPSHVGERSAACTVAAEAARSTA